MTAKQAKLSANNQLSFTVETPLRTLAPRHLVLAKSRVVTTEVFDTYWRFAAERQNVFFRRAAASQPPWTQTQFCCGSVLPMPTV
jgi:hypothetical protein